MKRYSVAIWCKVDPFTGKKCRPFLIRSARVWAKSMNSAHLNTFVGNTEYVGRISELDGNAFIR